MTLPSIRHGFPSKDPRKQGNVYQLTSTRRIADEALVKSAEAVRDVRVIYWQIGALWLIITALVVRVCL